MVKKYHDNGLLICAGMTSVLTGAGRSSNWILGNSSQREYVARWLHIPLATWEVRPKQNFIELGFGKDRV